VVIGKKVVYAPAGIGAGPSSQERANVVAGAINKLLDSGITPKDLSENPSHDRLLAKGQEVLKIDAADTRLMGQDTEALLTRARSALQYAIWADWLCDRCPLVQMQAEEESD
jgi:hypothetical protein